MYRGISGYQVILETLQEVKNWLKEGLYIVNCRLKNIDIGILGRLTMNESEYLFYSTKYTS